ncbi:MAG TPA: cytochrome ubiquinol oxidase subunit I [Vicinamibacterales bacterium]|jgi:mono/diheme cytochrome c family protein
MDYPLWSLPAKGLLIAFVAVVHVFISHFAVGGGLFLVLAERKARREGDEALLGYVRQHSRFFVMLTLVFGAITGVGIWSTIGLVHPQATSTLISVFLWAWAIEWTLFATEIAAAMVYYYGWDRLDARTHVTVGWIYFVAAWLSLFVINSILSFMLTPGSWITNRSLVSGFLNPTFLPSLVARTLVAFGLAGLYALLTAARMRDPALKEKVARYALRWIVPMAIGLPVAVTSYLGVAFLVGVPIGEPLGGNSGAVDGLASALLHGSASGNPVAIRATQVVIVASTWTLLLALVATTIRRRRYGLPLALAILAATFTAMGAGEWVREDLRKPYVIGGYMFVNGVRATSAADDRFSITTVNRDGVLQSALWKRPIGATADRTAAEGAEVFRLLCTPCHTQDGYLAIRPLVRGRGQEAIRSTLANLDTWRGRRMPPFTGTNAEREALSAYLTRLGGGRLTPRLDGPSADVGYTYFEANCSACHGSGADFQIGGRGRTVAQYYETLGRLPQVNDVMSAFNGTDDQRRALADYLTTLPAAAGTRGVR